MFALAGRFVPGATAGFARQSHNPSVTVARNRERLQRMFRVEIFWRERTAVHLRGMIQDLFRYWARRQRSCGRGGASLALWRARAVERWQRGCGGCYPLRHGLRHAFFQVGSRSIDVDASGRYCSCGLRDGSSDADGFKVGGPEPEIETTCIGLAVGGYFNFLVIGEDVGKVAGGIEHQTDVVQLDRA